MSLYLLRKLALVLLAGLFVGQSSFAQDIVQLRNQERIKFLEGRVQKIEGMLAQLNQRMRSLEHSDSYRPKQPAELQEVACMIIDSGYSKPFLGKGRIALEAEGAAREACGKTVHSSYCQGQVKCTNPQADRRINGAICVLTDTGYSRSFKADSKTLIEAEYNTRKACADSVHSSYCVGAIRCETY